MRAKRLNDDGVAKLRVKAKRYAEPDPELRGHYIRVEPSDSKTFWVVTRDPAGKQHWRQVGSFPNLGIEDARTQAAKVIKSIRGSTPNSFTTIAATWRKLHCEARKLRSLPEIDRHLKRMNSAWDGRDFANIGRADIAKLLDEIGMNNESVSMCLPGAAEGLLAGGRSSGGRLTRS